MYKVSDLSMEYKKKLITADQAAAMVKNGDRLHFGLGCGSIIDIAKAIAKRAAELRDRIRALDKGQPVAGGEGEEA